MKLFDWISELIFRRLVSPLVPAKHISSTYQLPKSNARQLQTLEIVTHCWQYSHLFLFQLQSIFENPPKNFKLIVTVMFAQEDTKTVDLVEQYTAACCSNVVLNPVILSKNMLFRRAIGRNLAAKNSEADWIWFTDCDVVFGPNAFTSLFPLLSDTEDMLVFPGQVYVTDLLKKNSSLFDANAHKDQIFHQGWTDHFKTRSPGKATGPLQIVRTDVVRSIGYCDALWFYQTPVKHWAKAYEDTAFRWTLGTSGTPLSIKDVFIIRHQEKGRYRKGSFKDLLRKYVRLIFSP